MLIFRVKKMTTKGVKETRNRLNMFEHSGQTFSLVASSTKLSAPYRASPYYDTKQGPARLGPCFLAVNIILPILSHLDMPL